MADRKKSTPKEDKVFGLFKKSWEVNLSTFAYSIGSLVVTGAFFAGILLTKVNQVVTQSNEISVALNGLPGAPGLLANVEVI